MGKYDFQGKWAIIDREAMKFVAIAEGHELATLIADIASVETTIVSFPLDVQRHFSHFSALEMKMLHKNTTGIPTVPGSVLSYGSTIKDCYDLAVNQIPVDTRTVFELNAEIAKLPPPEESDHKTRTPPFLTKLSDAQNYPATSTVKSAIPKVPRAAASPGAAPSKGATGKVWTIADRVRAESGNSPVDKTLRAKIIAACEAEGINAGTAATQYGKWKATQS